MRMRRKSRASASPTPTRAPATPTFTPLPTVTALTTSTPSGVDRRFWRMRLWSSAGHLLHRHSDLPMDGGASQIRDEQSTAGVTGGSKVVESIGGWKNIAEEASMKCLSHPRGRRRGEVVAPESSEKCDCANAAAHGKVVKVPTAMVPRKSAVDKELAVRRALAIKRVLDDDGDDSLKDTVRDFLLFANTFSYFVSINWLQFKTSKSKFFVHLSFFILFLINVVVGFLISACGIGAMSK